jgi:hypothetical protein
MEQARADELTLRSIHSLLNGNEWDGETLAEIAKHIEAAGFYIAEINEASNVELTLGHGECACRECGIREIAARDYVRYPLHGRP